MKPAQFVAVADAQWRAFCAKTKRSPFQNLQFAENWRDSASYEGTERFMDYEEFMKNELRAHFATIAAWERLPSPRKTS